MSEHDKITYTMSDENGTVTITSSDGERNESPHSSLVRRLSIPLRDEDDKVDKAIVKHSLSISEIFGGRGTDIYEARTVLGNKFVGGDGSDRVLYTDTGDSEFTIAGTAERFSVSMGKLKDSFEEVEYLIFKGNNSQKFHFKGNLGALEVDSGGGTDEFIIEDGVIVTIGNFNINTDKIDLRGVSTASYEALEKLLSNAQISESNSLIFQEGDNTTKITLSGVNITGLSLYENFILSDSQKGSFTFALDADGEINEDKISDINGNVNKPIFDASALSSEQPLIVNLSENRYIVLGHTNAISGIDHIIGGDGADTLVGSNGDERLVGGGGADTLRGGGGDDELFGGNGADKLYGDGFYVTQTIGGDDILYGGTGNDRLFGDGSGAQNIGGDDILYGGTGNDYLYGDGSGAQNIGGDDILYGGAGNDYLYGDGSYLTQNVGGDDILYGGEGDDTLYGDGLFWVTQNTGGDDILYGGTGNDTLYGDGIDVTQNTGGDDILYGGTGNDRLFGDGGRLSQSRGGDDILYGGTGNDYLYGDAIYGTQNIGGDDILYGGTGNDYLYGDGIYVIQNIGGDDILYGGTGNDTLYGDGIDVIQNIGGDDILIGGEGYDRLFGQSGDDILYADGGGDYLSGGSGRDTFAISNGDTATVRDFTQGVDKIDVRGVSVTDIKEALNGMNGNVLSFKEGEEVLTQITLLGISNVKTFTIDDFIRDATQGGDTYYLDRNGDRTIDKDTEVRHITGSDDASIFDASALSDSQPLTANLSRGTYNINGQSQSIVGIDQVIGGEGSDRLIGDTGENILYGGGGDDRLGGHRGNDTLYGGEGQDSIYGGGGDDTLYADGDGDSLWGGNGFSYSVQSGRDTFVISDGATATIHDFDVGFEDDILDFRGVTGFDNIRDLSVNHRGSDSVLTFGEGVNAIHLTLKGISYSVNKDDFLINSAPASSPGEPAPSDNPFQEYADSIPAPEDGI